MSDLQNIEMALEGLSTAIDALPYHEDLEQGTQRRRDWVCVRDHLRAAMTRLRSMEAKHNA